MTTAVTDRWLSPPQLAEQFGVDAEKILNWIRRGDLAAVNLAENLGGRPRYRISPEAIEKFLLTRSTSPPPKPIRRRRASGLTPKYYQ